MRRLLLAALVASGCTTVLVRPPPECDLVTGANCPVPPQQMTEQERAEMGYGQECAKDIIDSCIRLGRLYISEGKLVEAELPLRKAYRDDDEEGAVALAELYEARGDYETGKQLRWEALAIDKANSETSIWYRPAYPQGQGAGFTVNVQPMAFFARRLDIGFEMAFASTGVTEIDVFAGYQHFFTDSVVGFAQALLGDIPQPTTGQFNYGADCGVKLIYKNYIGVSIGFGGSRASPIHGMVGVTFNSLGWIVPALLLLSSR